MKRFLLLFSLMLLVSTLAMSQISITCSALTYTQNFNSYNPSNASNFSSTIPAGWSGSSSGTPVYNGQGNGSSATGGYWGYGSASEYSLGALRSGTPGNITYTVQFTNNTGATITALAISYDFEQWRFANTSGFSVTGTNIGASVSGLSQNGNNSGTDGTVQVTNKSVNLTSLSINNGATFSIIWVTTDVTGSDNGIAVDNFSLTASVTPSTQVSAINITNASPTSQSLVLTRGNGSNVLVVARQGAALTADPVVGTTYTANTAYGSGSALGGGFVIYNGTGTSFTVTGQTNGQTYFYRAYEFNCTTAPAYRTPSFEASKLPIELISFQGTAQNKAARLTFSTATEINNAYFSIERSADGARYEAIGQVPGAGTSTVINTYTYTDEQPLPGINYYRLRQVDFDGQFAYSPVVSVVFGGTDARLLIAPSPASDDVTVQLTQPTAEPISWEVYDQGGRMVLQGTAGSEIEQFGFNVGALAEGFYILRVSNGREVMVERFQKR